MQQKKDRSWIREVETIALPVVLLLTGLILIGGDRVGVFSLDRIENLWPVALILVGLSDLLSSSNDDSRDTSVQSKNSARTEARRV